MLIEVSTSAEHHGGLESAMRVVLSPDRQPAEVRLRPFPRGGAGYRCRGERLPLLPICLRSQPTITATGADLQLRALHLHPFDPIAVGITVSEGGVTIAKLADRSVRLDPRTDFEGNRVLPTRAV